jgi:hypothetical protein
MAGLKVTLDAAMRARDVSRPTAAQESDAELALPDRLAARRPPASNPLPEPGRRQPGPGPGPGPQARPPRRTPPRDNTPGDNSPGDNSPGDNSAADHPAGERSAHEYPAEPAPKPGPPRPGRPLPRRGPGRRPFRPGGAAAGTAQDDSTAAPDSPDQETADARNRHPRMRRRNRLGRLADPSGDPPADVT